MDKERHRMSHKNKEKNTQETKLIKQSEAH